MILEREIELGVLAQLVDETESVGGRVVLVRGEAGIGKSALVSRFLRDSQEKARTLLGACDDLFTPQPFGPIWDIARTEPSLVESLRDDDRRAVMDAVHDLLSRPQLPTVMVLEDTQWADEATLDLIKFLGRRVAQANGILVLTYRDVEVDAEHPLRQVIGELPPQNLVRMPLSRLSSDAVASMVEPESFDVDTILTLTGGNPLFVTEVLASGTDAVPLSLTDAVIARASKLSPEARRILDLASVVPGEVETWLLDKIAQPTEEHLAEGVRQGLLRVDARSLSFAHDLQRRAVESSLAPTDRRRLNQQILDTLRDSADPARLVHHATEAQDVDAIVEFAPRAARTAMATESTTEAAAHFRALEPYLGRVEAVDRATILADWAQVESYLDNHESVDLFDRAIELFRAADDQITLAKTLGEASLVNRTHRRHANARSYTAEAVSILERFGPSRELARSLSQKAFVEFVYTDENARVYPLIHRAMAAAEEVGDDEAMSYALKAEAHLTFSRGDMNGLVIMEECLRRAKLAEDHWAETVALGNMAGMCGDIREVARASDLAQRARDTAARYELRSREADARSMHAELQLWTGDWEAAEDGASELLGANLGVQTLAWRVLAQIQTRRGRNEARTAIQRMWSMVLPDDGATVIDPAAAALAEYIWLTDDRDPEIMARLERLLAEGIALGNPWPSGAFAFWMWKLGLLDTAPPGTADFYGWIINGEYRKSAAFWREKGIPYEEGLALMHGDEAEQVEAIRIFESLGATATANKARKSLADQGVRVPRGRSRATRDHAAGLTARQDEVLALVAQGLTNSEIADHLFLSHRTVENHVSAVLMKLDVASRDAAVDAARNQGLLD